jgi:NAD+ kinase
MNIAVYGNRFEDSFAIDFIAFVSRLEKKGVQFCFYNVFWEKIKHLNPDFTPKIFACLSELNQHVDFVFSVGGDGTLLDTVSLVHCSDIPVVGINTGRLGFLANVAPERLSELEKAILENTYEIEKRALLACSCSDDLQPQLPLALNEITIQKTGLSLITINVWVDEVFLNTYWTDGLIISTPTGSTAYSLSVGGPIVMPGSGVFILSPIASHNLTVRPLIIRDNTKLRLKIESRSMSYLATIDHHAVQLSTDVEIYIQRATESFSLVKFDGIDFFSTIRQKLMWGADKRN